MGLIGANAALVQLAADIHKTAMLKGFWDTPSAKTLHLVLKLSLVISEAVEALETLRKPYEGETGRYGMTSLQAEEFFEELADIIIRTLDITGHFNWNIDDVIRRKMEKNTDRPRLHGKKF